MKKNFKLKGLDCANCATKIEEKINKIDGVENATVSFMMQKLSFECNENESQEIIDKIKKVIKKEESDVEVEEI